MDYIKRTLGLHCTRKRWDGQKKLPYYLLNEYSFDVVTIGHQDCIFLTPKNKLATVNTIKKHLNQLREHSTYPAVLELQGITRQRKDSFIKARIPFVVSGKQLYLPFIGAVLSERNNPVTSVLDTEKLIPSAQMLLFAFLLGKNKPLYLSEVTNRFHLTSMSISRAASQLVRLKLVERKNAGVRKFIFSETTPAELFKLAKHRCFNPVRKEVFISRDEAKQTLFSAGLTALSEVSMLNPPSMPVYGTIESEMNFESASTELTNSEIFAALQIWRYDPRLVSQSDQVDTLSLYMSLTENRGERVEQALEELLREIF